MEWIIKRVIALATYNAKELSGTERLPTKIYGGIIWSGLYEEKRKIIFFLNHDHFGKFRHKIIFSGRC